MATNLQFIKSETITTAVTSVSIGTTSNKLFTSQYDNYCITGGLVMSSTSFADIHLNVIDSGGSVDTTGGAYAYAGMRLNTNASFNDQNSTSQGYLNGFFGIADLAPENNGFVTYVINPANSSSFTFFQGQTSSSVNGFIRGEKTIGVHEVAEEIIGIRLITANGTSSFTGKINIYGVL